MKETEATYQSATRQTLLGLALVVVATSTVLAHQDFVQIQTLDKVKVRIRTGFDYEEIRKAWMIVELTDRLAKEFGYQDTVLLDFIHAYGGGVQPQYFVSFGDGSIEPLDRNQWYGESALLSDSKAVVVRQISSVFDVATSLKLVEYSILNAHIILSKQKALEYKRGFYGQLVLTIDTSEVRRIASGPISETVDRVLQTRVNRQERSDFTDRSAGISYFFQSGKYFVYSKDLDSKLKQIDTILLSVDRVAQFVRLGDYKAVIFDSDSTFYYVGTIGSPMVSKHHTIKRIGNCWLAPLDVCSIGGDKIAIYFLWSNPKNNQFGERTLIYRAKQDDLIQDLDAVLDRQSRQ